MGIFIRADQFVKNVLGSAVSGAHLYWLTQPATVPTSEQGIGPTPLATTYTDSSGVTTLPQPIVTDGFGHSDAYLSPGIYTLAVYNNGSLMATYPDQSIGVGGGASNVNGLTGAVSIVGGTNIAVQVIGSSIVISSTITSLVSSLNSLTGAVSITAGTGVSISVIGSSIQISSTNAPMSGNGTYFFGPGITDLGFITEGSWAGVDPATANGSSVANQVVCYLFELTSSWTISKATVQATNNTFGQKGSFGIYSFSGNKLVDAGQFNTLTSPANQTNTFAPVTLQPGTYWHAQTSTVISNGTFLGLRVSSTATTIFTLLNNNTTRSAIAANPSVGGVLPTTLGALTAFAPSNSNSDGICTPLYE